MKLLIEIYVDWSARNKPNEMLTTNNDVFDYFIFKQQDFTSFFFLFNCNYSRAVA